MIKTKIVIVGGGDYKTAPKLLGDILLTKKLNGAEVVLYSMDEHALDVMQQLAGKMIGKTQSKCSIVVSTDLEDALQGASFVVANIYVGSLDGMRSDIEIPSNFGIHQTMGEATGPGGIFRALRTVPVFMELVKQMERFCPEAWLVNLTQPIDILCRMVDKTSSIRVIGVSDDLPATMKFLKKVLQTGGKKKDDALTVKIGGINRMGWLLEVRAGHEDAMEQLTKHILNRGRSGGKRRGRKGGGGGGGEDQRLIKFELFRLFGYLPYADDRKLAEYFPYFLTPENNRGEKYGVRTVNLKRLRSDLKDVKNKIERVASSDSQIGFNKTDSEFADVIACLARGDEGTFILNLPNKGSVANLPVEAIVEVPVLIKDRKLMPQFVGDLPAGVLGTVEPHVIKQGIVMEAALKGNRDLVKQALALDPLVRSLTGVDKMCDQLINAHKDYLPQFFLKTEPVIEMPKPVAEEEDAADTGARDESTDQAAPAPEQDVQAEAPEQPAEPEQTAADDAPDPAAIPPEEASADADRAAAQHPA